MTFFFFGRDDKEEMGKSEYLYRSSNFTGSVRCWGKLSMLHILFINRGQCIFVTKMMPKLYHSILR